MAGRHRRADAPQPARGRWLAIVGAVVVVVALAVVLPLVLLGRGGDGSNAASNSPTTTPPASTTSSSAQPSTTQPPTPTTTTPPPTTTSATRTSSPSHPPSPPPPTLVVRADRADSWLIVTDARGHQQYNALLRRGDTKKFDGPFFHVIIGFPPGVVVTVDGKQQPRGGAGKVLRFDVHGR